MRYYTTEQRIASFWKTVSITSDDEQCWNWLAGCDKDGYGTRYWNGKHNRAHKVAWIITNGAIPQGLCILHSCDNPSCCNPKHLSLGTTLDNVKDRDAKGRTAHNGGEKHGEHKLKDSQVDEIRTRYAMGNVSQYALAREFNVSQQHISALILRKERK